MAKLPEIFKTADIPDTGGVTLIDEGTYTAVIVSSDLKETNNKKGMYLQLQVVITDGQYANTEFTERLNIVNDNQKAVEIAYRTLARISEAVGMDSTPADSEELHNKKLMIEVKTEKGKPWTDNEGNEREGKDKSVIYKFYPLPASGVSAKPKAAASAFAAEPAKALPWKK